MSGEFRDIPSMLAALKPDEPVYAFRPHELRQAAQLFTTLFPGDVIYPVAANCRSDFLNALYTGGVRHFGVANLNELRRVKECLPQAECHFLHPVKSVSAIREAAHKYNVTHFAIDHVDELAKIIVHTVPLKPIIMIRLAMPRSLAAYDAIGKFGCSIAEAAALMRAAAAEGFGVGLGFQCGPDADLARCRRGFELIHQAMRSASIQPEWIDIGGGFFAAAIAGRGPPLADYIDTIRDGFAHLPLHQPARLSCQPARALAAPGASLLVRVELRRGNRLYLNDGVQGGLAELQSATLVAPMRVWRINGSVQPLASALDEFDFYGPSPDDGDRLNGPFALPGEIRIGDYIEIGHMGAHSFNRRSDFGGFLSATHVIVNDPAFLF